MTQKAVPKMTHKIKGLAEQVSRTRGGEGTFGWSTKIFSSLSALLSLSRSLHAVAAAAGAALSLSLSSLSLSLSLYLSPYRLSTCPWHSSKKIRSCVIKVCTTDDLSGCGMHGEAPLLSPQYGLQLVVLRERDMCEPHYAGPGQTVAKNNDTHTHTCVQSALTLCVVSSTFPTVNAFLHLCPPPMRLNN